MMQTYYSVKTFSFLLTVMLFTAGFSKCKRHLPSETESASNVLQFELRLDSLRKTSAIPGMTAGIIKEDKVLWIRNYGYADVEKNIPVKNSTIFHLASLTKTFASAVIVQLVQQGKIDLNDPVSKYGIVLSEKDSFRVVHLLTHTSQGIPGSNYQYNGDRYALLSKVLEVATGQAFHKLVLDKIIKPLGLKNTAPGRMNLASADAFDTFTLKQNTAQGYASNGLLKVDYPKNFSTAAGLASNIDDMLKYASAYDGDSFLNDEMKAKVFSPMISNSGKALPYGLGWFLQEIEGVKLAWHYGYWIGMSSLIIRVPDKKLSFVIMANSDMLSAPYPLGNGDLWVSPYAKEFLKSFVLKGAKL